MTKAECGKPMYRVSDVVRSTHGQDGGVVLDVRQGQMFKLNLVGSRVLELLKDGATEDRIVQTISHEFNTRRDLVENDVREFIMLLEKHGLLCEHA